MKEIILEVEGMHCSGCEKRVENVAMMSEGVISVKADHDTGKVIINFENDVNINEIKESILDLGFTVKE